MRTHYYLIFSRSLLFAFPAVFDPFHSSLPLVVLCLIRSVQIISPAIDMIELM
jgi:hypothetical protein